MSEYKIRSSYFSKKNKIILLICIIFFTCSTHIFKSVFPFLFMLTKITATTDDSNSTFFSLFPLSVKKGRSDEYTKNEVSEYFSGVDHSVKRNTHNQFDKENDCVSTKGESLEIQQKNSMTEIKTDTPEGESVKNEMKYDKCENKIFNRHLEGNLDVSVEKNVNMLYKNSAYDNGTLKTLLNAPKNFKGMSDYSIYFYSNVLTLVYISSLSTYLIILLFGVSKKNSVLKVVYMTNLIAHCVIFFILDNIQLYGLSSSNGVSVIDISQNNKVAFLKQKKTTLHNLEVKQKNINLYFKYNFNSAYLINNKNGSSVFPPNYSLFLLQLNKFLSVQEQADAQKVEVGERWGHFSNQKIEWYTNEKKKQPEGIKENEIKVINKFSQKRDNTRKEQGEKESIFTERKMYDNSVWNADKSHMDIGNIDASNIEKFEGEPIISENSYRWYYFSLLYLFIIVSSVCGGYINIYQKRILYCIFYINIGSITSLLILINSIFKLLAHFLNYFFTYALKRRISDYIFLFVIIDVIGLVMIALFHFMWNNQKYLWINLHRIFYNHKYVCFHLNNTYYIYSTDKNIDNILVNIDMCCNKNIEISFCAYTNLEKSVFYEYFILNKFRRHKLKIVEIKDKNFKIESTYKSRNVVVESKSGRCKDGKNAYSKEKNDMSRTNMDKYNRRKNQSFTMKPYSICIETLNSDDVKKITLLDTTQKEIEKTRMETKDDTVETKKVDDKQRTNEINDTNKMTEANGIQNVSSNKDIIILPQYEKSYSFNYMDQTKDGKIQCVNSKNETVNYANAFSSNDGLCFAEKNESFIHKRDDVFNLNNGLLISKKNDHNYMELMNISHTKKQNKTKHLHKDEEPSNILNILHHPLKEDADGSEEYNSIGKEQINKEIKDQIHLEKNTTISESDFKKGKNIKFQLEEKEDDRNNELGDVVETENEKKELEKREMEKKKNVLLIPEYDEVLNGDAEDEEEQLVADAYYEDFGITYETSEFSSLRNDYREEMNSKIYAKIKAHLSSYTFSFFFFTFIYAFLLSIIHIFINYFFYIYLFVFDINIYVSNMYTIIMTAVSLLAIPFSGYIVDHIGAFFSLLLCSSFFITIAVSGTIYSYKNNLSTTIKCKATTPLQKKIAFFYHVHSSIYFLFFKYSEVLAILFFNLIGLSESIIPTVIISQIPTHLCVKNNEQIPSAFAIFELVSMVIISFSNYIFGLFLRKSEYLQGLYILFVLTVLVMLLILVLIFKTHFNNKRNKTNIFVKDLNSCDLAQPLL